MTLVIAVMFFSREIASYLVLQKNIVNYHCEAQPIPKKSVDHLQMSYFEEPI